MFSLICVWINGWVNNRVAGDLRRHRGHYDVSVMENATADGVRAIQRTTVSIAMHRAHLEIYFLNEKWDILIVDPDNCLVPIRQQVIKTNTSKTRINLLPLMLFFAISNKRHALTFDLIQNRQSVGVLRKHWKASVKCKKKKFTVSPDKRGHMHPADILNYRCNRWSLGMDKIIFTPHFTRHVITYPCWDLS